MAPGAIGMYPHFANPSTRLLVPSSLWVTWRTIIGAAMTSEIVVLFRASFGFAESPRANLIQSAGHEFMHFLWIVTFHKIGRPTTPA